jgi:hypothetical protein
VPPGNCSGCAAAEDGATMDGATTLLPDSCAAAAPPARCTAGLVRVEALM